MFEDFLRFMTSYPNNKGVVSLDQVIADYTELIHNRLKKQPDITEYVTIQTAQVHEDLEYAFQVFCEELNGSEYSAPYAMILLILNMLSSIGYDFSEFDRVENTLTIDRITLHLPSKKAAKKIYSRFRYDWLMNQINEIIDNNITLSQLEDMYTILRPNKEK